MNLRKRIISLLSACVLIGTVVLEGCRKPDTYRPVYYPDKDNLSIYSRGPSFDGLAQARQWAEDQRRQRRDANWTYEVGKNCRPFQDSDLEVCEETVR
jgi:hypothetical protein